MEFYHVLNRGVDKRQTFLDDQDRARFVHNLFEFNDVKNTPNNDRLFTQASKKEKEVNQKPRKLLVQLHCFTLMENHYHLLLSPLVDGGISKFMKKLNMGYAKYFNQKYERTGALWQGKYKSVHIKNDRHLLFIPYYIHFNPLDFCFPKWRDRDIKKSDSRKALTFLESYRWSSHLDYLGRKNFPSVTQRGFFNNLFSGTNGYAKLVRKELDEFETSEFLDATLE